MEYFYSIEEIGYEKGFIEFELSAGEQYCII
jgi:hypothetical protein